MEAALRKPFQGVFNIIRFNWHFYAIATLLIIALIIVSNFFTHAAYWTCLIIAGGIFLSTTISLTVSYYVYDHSNLYEFGWLKEFSFTKPKMVANINAGFDETSSIIAQCFPDAKLDVFDFYNPDKHTEISIERARKAYAPYRGTLQISTSSLPLQGRSADLLFNIFALHEIRDREERIAFLRSQRSALTESGHCIIMEHLRDLPNFLAYNIGFFHFFSPAEWKHNFSEAGFTINRSFKITPFVSVYILTAH
jgi:hypothetical protein